MSLDLCSSDSRQRARTHDTGLYKLLEYSSTLGSLGAYPRRGRAAPCGACPLFCNCTGKMVLQNGKSEFGKPGTVVYPRTEPPPTSFRFSWVFFPALPHTLRGCTRLGLAGVELKALSGSLLARVLLGGRQSSFCSTSASDLLVYRRSSTLPASLPNKRRHRCVGVECVLCIVCVSQQQRHQSYNALSLPRRLQGRGWVKERASESNTGSI